MIYQAVNTAVDAPEAHDVGSGDSRNELLREADDLLAKSFQQASVLRRGGTSEGADQLLRSVHSYKSLMAFAGAVPETALAAKVEDYVDAIWRGTVTLDPSAHDLIHSCLSALQNGNPSSPAAVARYRRLEARITAELASALGPRPQVAARMPAPGTECPSPAALSVRLSLAELEEFYATSAGMARIASRLAEAQETQDPRQAELAAALRQSAEALQAAIRRHARLGLKSFLLPLAGGLHAMADSQGKRVAVRINTPDEEVERPLLQALRPAVLHLLRNAIYHGIEAPDVRLNAGKSVEGHVLISAEIENGWLHLSVEDDGGGFDTEAMRRALASAPEDSGWRAKPGADDDPLNLAFLPGLSTAAESNELAGLGMGLPVAAEDVAALGGTVKLESRPGQGSRVALSVPLPRRRLG